MAIPEPSTPKSTSTRRDGPAGDPRFPSDLILGLRHLLATYPQAAAVLGLPRQYRVVIDAAPARRDIVWTISKAIQKDARTALVELMDSETLVIYAPDWLRTEVAKYLGEIAADAGVSELEADARWRELEARIRFLGDEELLDIVVPNPQVDEKDVPYVKVRLAVGAVAVLSDDKHFQAMETPLLGSHGLRRLRDYTRELSVHLSITIGGSIAFTISASAAARLVTNLVCAVSGAIRNAPTWLNVALGIGGIATLLHPSGRRISLDLLLRLRDSFATAWKGIEPILSDLALRSAAAKRRATSHLEQAGIVAPPDGTSLRKLLYAILVGQRCPQSLAQIEVAVRASGYVTRAKLLKPYILRLLRSDKRFRCTIGRWTSSSSAAMSKLRNPLSPDFGVAPS